jgi:hypothetical protein
MRAGPQLMRNSQGFAIWMHPEDVVTIHAGQADPADATHFTIPVRMNGKQSVLDGWLRDDNTVRLKPRGGHYVERRSDDWVWAPDGSRWETEPPWGGRKPLSVVPNHGQDPP